MRIGMGWEEDAGGGMQIPRMRTSQAEVAISVKALRPEQARGDLGTRRTPLSLEKKKKNRWRVRM